MSNEWAPQTRRVTFPSGRTATLRASVNVFAVGTETGLGLDLTNPNHDPDLTMGEVVLGILKYLWLDPVVLGPGEKPPKDGVSISFSDLATDEVVGSLEVWKEDAEKAMRFRDESAGSGSGEGGEGVEAGAKPTPRSCARKPAGARR